jgi:hypothetical protein
MRHHSRLYSKAINDLFVCVVKLTVQLAWVGYQLQAQAAAVHRMWQGPEGCLDSEYAGGTKRRHRTAAVLRVPMIHVWWGCLMHQGGEPPFWLTRKWLAVQ